ncbi:unnamed protein product [Boreogadus saida]
MGPGLEWGRVRSGAESEVGPGLGWGRVLSGAESVVGPVPGKRTGPEWGRVWGGAGQAAGPCVVSGVSLSASILHAVGQGLGWSRPSSGSVCRVRCVPVCFHSTCCGAGSGVEPAKQRVRVSCQVLW